MQQVQVVNIQKVKKYIYEKSCNVIVNLTVDERQRISTPFMPNFAIM